MGENLLVQRHSFTFPEAAPPHKLRAGHDFSFKALVCLWFQSVPQTSVKALEAVGVGTPEVWAWGSAHSTYLVGRSPGVHCVQPFAVREELEKRVPLGMMMAAVAAVGVAMAVVVVAANLCLALTLYTRNFILFFLVQIYLFGESEWEEGERISSGLPADHRTQSI